MKPVLLVKKDKPVKIKTNGKSRETVLPSRYEHYFMLGIPIPECGGYTGVVYHKWFDRSSSYLSTITKKEVKEFRIRKISSNGILKFLIKVKDEEARSFLKDILKISLGGK